MSNTAGTSVPGTNKCVVHRPGTIQDTYTKTHYVRTGDSGYSDTRLSGPGFPFNYNRDGG